MIQREDWDAWLEMPQTKALREIAAGRRKEIKDRWEEGEFSESMIKNAMLIGGCKALQLLEELDYEMIIEGEMEIEK